MYSQHYFGIERAGVVTDKGRKKFPTTTWLRVSVNMPRAVHTRYKIKALLDIHTYNTYIPVERSDIYVFHFSSIGCYFLWTSNFLWLLKPKLHCSYHERGVI